MECEPIDPDKAKETALAVPCPGSDDPLSLLLRPDVNDGVFSKQGCPLCSSPNRIEAEQLFENHKPVTHIKTWLEEKKEFMSLARLYAHFREHYASQEKIAFVIEYRDRLAELSKRRKDRRRDLENVVNVGFVELARIIGLPATDIEQEHRRNDMIVKTLKSIRESISQLETMEGSEKHTMAIQDQIINIFNFQLKNAKTDEEKKVLVSTLEGLKTNLAMEGDFKNA